MRLISVLQKLAPALAMTGLLVATVMPAHAKERSASEYQKEFERYTQTISDLKSKDTNGAITQELEMIRTWVSQGQAFLASEKLEEINPLLDRAEAVSRFAAVKLSRVAVEDVLRRTLDEANKADEEARGAQARLQSALDKKKKLEAMGL